MVLNPEHGIISDRPLAREDVQLLVDMCVQKLSEEYSPSLAMIQMQVYFDNNFAPRHDMISENRANIKLQITPLVKEIIETYAKTKEDLDKMYRKLVVTTVISSGLGNPSHNSILKEATGKFNIQNFMVIVVSGIVTPSHCLFNSVVWSLSVCLSMKKECMLKLFLNKVLWRILGLKKDKQGNEEKCIMRTFKLSTLNLVLLG
jgi:hypothetical protein